MERDLRNPPDVHTPQAHYSHVARVGQTLYIAGQLGLFRSGRLEQHRFGIAFEDAAHVEEVNRLLVHFAFAFIDELVDEIAQPETFGIDCGHGKSSDWRPI